MIIIISEKDVTRKKGKLMTKLAGYMDYFIMDATNQKGKGLVDLNYCVPAPGFVVPAKCHDSDDDSDGMDLTYGESDKTKKAWKKFTKTNEFRESVFAMVQQFVDYRSDRNFFVVLKNKDYKKFAGKMRKAMYKALDIDPEEVDFIFIYDEMDKKYLEKRLSDKKLGRLEKRMKSITKDLLHIDNKKDKKKDKDKKKKKKFSCSYN